MSDLETLHASIMLLCGPLLIGGFRGNVGTGMSSMISLSDGLICANVDPWSSHSAPSLAWSDKIP